MAALSEAEHEATVEALNDRIRGESWTQDTELLARAVDLLGAIFAQLQAGILTAQPKSVRGFGKAQFPDPVKRPEWLTADDEPVDDGVAVVTPGQLAALFMGS